MTFFSRHFIAAAVLTALALPALAESTPVAAPAEAAAKAPVVRQGQGQQSQAQRQAQREARMAKHATEFKAQLHLTPEQDGAWTNFTNAMQAPQNHARLGMEGADKLTTPERIERMQAILVQRSAALEHRAEIVKTFYAVLTPAQQKTFDAHHGAMHRGMQGRMQGGMQGGMQAPQAPNASAEPGHEYCHPGMMAPRQNRPRIRAMSPAKAPTAAPVAAPTEAK